MEQDNNPSKKNHPLTFEGIIFQAKSGFLAVSIFSFFLNLLMLTAPLYMLQIFDRVLASRSMDTLLWLTLIAIIAFSILSLLDVIRNRILGEIGTWLDSSLGAILVHEGLQKSASLPNRTLPSNSLRDLALIRKFLSGSGTLALIDVPWTPFFIIIIYMLHPWLGTLALCGILILILLTLVGEINARKYLQKSGADRSDLHTTIDSASHTADALVSMGALERIIALWKEKNNLLLQNTQKMNGKLATAVAFGKFTRMSLQVIIMGIGAYLVINDELTPGGMMAASIILTRALAPIEQLISAWRAFIGSRNAIKRVISQVNDFHSTQRLVILPQPEGHISVENISFALTSENRFLFRDISFKLKPGEVLGIIGQSGSGKSTLAKILVGLIPPTVGYARIDGSDISRWDLNEMGRFIGYLPQGFELFDGTIRQNIARFSDVPIEEVIKATKLAGIHSFITRLPNGYETTIGRGTKLLSGGQQQRIALARALFGSPSVIVMDEPNANLDPGGEAALLRAIQALKEQGKTIVLIAHRSNILRSSDYILMMKEGGYKLVSRNVPAEADKTLGESYKYINDIATNSDTDTSDEVSQGARHA